MTIGVDTLAFRLKNARKKAGLTQDQLAERVGATRDQIQKIESGTTKRPRNMTEIAKTLDVSPSWLAFGDDRIDDLSKEAIDLALDWQGLPDDLKEAVRRMIDATKQA